MNHNRKQLLAEARHLMLRAKRLWVEAAEAPNNLHFSHEQNARNLEDSAQRTVHYASSLMASANLDEDAIQHELSKFGVSTDPVGDSLPQ